MVTAAVQRQSSLGGRVSAAYRRRPRRPSVRLTSRLVQPTAPASRAGGPSGPRIRPLRARPTTIGWTPSPWLTDPGSSPWPAAGDEAPPSQRWCRRPVLSALVRFLVVMASMAASTLAAIVASRLLPAPSGGTMLVAWWLGILAVAILVLLAVDSVARRLLPLATLLNLSLAFPDQAPDRFRVAFRAGTIRDLERQLIDARHRGVDDEPSEAAVTILALVSAMTAHDRRTRGHSERVRAFNDLLAEELHLAPQDRERLRWAALLHDVGKLCTPPRILNKPGPLTTEEWRVLQRHPEDGARMTASLRGWLGPWAAAIEQHHERWDGSGYPKGLAGHEISFGARIVAVADAYEVMTSPRPYQRAKTTRAARELTCSAAGSQFDPVVVRALMNASLGRLRKAVGPISWLASLPSMVSPSRMAYAAAGAGRQLVVAASAAAIVGMSTVSGAIETPPQPTSEPVAKEAARPPMPSADIPTPPPSPVGPAAGARPSWTAGQPAAEPDSAVTPTPQAVATPAPIRQGRSRIRIDLAKLGIGGGAPPIEVDVPLLEPLPPIDVQLPPWPLPATPPPPGP